MQKLREGLRTVAVSFAIYVALRTFVIQGFHIPSASMENTLLVGDLLFVAKPLYGAEVPLIHRRLPALREPERGDILVFDSVEEEGLEVVKRLVGVPGDRLAMRRGQLYRNGAPVSEPYVQHTAGGSPSPDPAQRARMRAWQLSHFAGPDTAGYQPDGDTWGPIVVPPDSLFVMGDNRDDSYDSRYWGFLPRDHVRGTPLIVYFSYDANSWRPVPYLTAVRWGRLFTRPK